MTRPWSRLPGRRWQGSLVQRRGPTSRRRVLRAISEIRAHLDEPCEPWLRCAHDWSVTRRLRHLFVAETGISYSAATFFLGALERSPVPRIGGTAWTEAAYAANFADSAHLSRTCQRMFGLAPTRADRAANGHRSLITCDHRLAPTFKADCDDRRKSVIANERSFNRKSTSHLITVAACFRRCRLPLSQSVASQSRK